MEKYLENLNNHYKSLTGMDLSISQLATIRTLVFSDTAIRHKIDNSLPQEYLQNALVWHDVIVLAFNYHYTITSGYRCPELNKKVGGVSTSLHQKALAVDFNVGNCSGGLMKSFFLMDLAQLLIPYKLEIKYHYMRDNMLHVELKYMKGGV